MTTLWDVHIVENLKNILCFTIELLWINLILWKRLPCYVFLLFKSPYRIRFSLETRCRQWKKNQDHCVYFCMNITSKHCFVSFLFVHQPQIPNITEYSQHCESRWLKCQVPSNSVAFKLRISTKYYYDYVVHTYNSKSWNILILFFIFFFELCYRVVKCKMLHLFQKEMRLLCTLIRARLSHQIE